MKEAGVYAQGGDSLILFSIFPPSNVSETSF